LSHRIKTTANKYMENLYFINLLPSTGYAASTALQSHSRSPLIRGKFPSDFAAQEKYRAK
jgi:hypothetical protein